MGYWSFAVPLLAALLAAGVDALTVRGPERVVRFFSAFAVFNVTLGVLIYLIWAPPLL